MEILNHVRKNGLGLVMDKYEHFAQELQDALIENKKALAKLKTATQEVLAEGEHKIKQVKREIKKNPWMYIGAASAAALVLGFALGKKK